MASCIPTQLLTDAAATDPMVFCRSQSTAGVALLTRRFGIRGYATSVHTACASGGQAIGTALKLIRRGSADYALAGGFDSMISPVGIGGFCLLSAVSADNDTPQRASRPFDATRNGFVLGEGRGLPRARGMGIRASARRAHLRRTRGRRQFAVFLPDHRLAARWRRPHPVHARGHQRRRCTAGRHRLHQRPRHVDDDERQERIGGHSRRVRHGDERRRRQFDQEHDGTSHRRRRRGRSRRLCADDSSRCDAGQRELSSIAIPTAISI